MQGNAKILFDKTHEIITLTGEKAATGDLTAHYPWIAAPDSSSFTSGLLNALLEGNHWIAVDSIGSDLPVIGIYDAALPFKSPRPELQTQFLEGLIKIGHEPVKIEQPMKLPVIVPPLARYFLGNTDAAALRNVGGEGDAGLTVVDDYYSFKVLMRFSREGWRAGSHAKDAYQFRLKSDVATPGTGVIVYNLYCPLVVKTKNQLFSDVHASSAATGNAVSYVDVSDDGYSVDGSQQLGVVSFMRWSVSNSNGHRILLRHVLTDAQAAPASLKAYHKNLFIEGEEVLDGF